MSKKKDVTLNEVGNLVQHVIKHMATKGDIVEVRKDIAELRTDIIEIRAEIIEIRTELADIRRRLDSLEEAVSDHSHYTKEIDHAFARIATIEKHLGIKAS